MSGATSTIGFTHTIPTISGCRDASHRVSAPPIDSPATTTAEERPASSV